MCNPQITHLSWYFCDELMGHIIHRWAYAQLYMQYMGTFLKYDFIYLWTNSLPINQIKFYHLKFSAYSQVYMVLLSFPLLQNVYATGSLSNTMQNLKTKELNIQQYMIKI